MPYPISEQIAQAIVVILETLEDGGGGDATYRLSDVVRPQKQDGYTPADRLAVLQMGDPDRDPDGPHMFAQWRRPYNVQLFIQAGAYDAIATDTVIETLRADVEKALMANPTLGGLAVDSMIGDPTGFVEVGGAFEGVEVTFIVTYRHLETDPYSQGGS